jgi:4'-phosphopantetheinyl transferase
VVLPEPPPCTVWWAAPAEPDGRPELVALLDDHERERLGRFRLAADRSRYLAAHALVRVVLGAVTGTSPAALRFDRTCRCGRPHGKPRLTGEGAPGFSLTHAGDLVGLAVRSDGPVGLDVELIRPMTDLASMASHVSSPHERRRGLPCAPAAFFTTWTRKEALLKATGAGLSTPMTSITLSSPDTDARVEEWTGEDAPSGPLWLHDLRPAPGHLAALAGPGAAAPAVLVADGDAVLRAAV